MTATDSRLMNSSMLALKKPISLWKLRLEVLNTSLAPSKRRCCSASLAKALVVRTPERPDSISALMAPVFCLAARDAWDIWRRRYITTSRNTGMMQHTTRASRHWMENITARAPMMVTREMNRSSGPWWASSVSSNRSVVRRLISWPVRFLS